MALIFPIAAPLDAQLYHNGAPDGVSGNEMGSWIQAEDFLLSGGATLTGGTFWGFASEQAPGYSGSFRWQIRADAGGTPGGVLATDLVTMPGVYDHDTAYGPSYRFDFNMGMVPLGAGTYWLALHNGELTETQYRRFFWETTASNATHAGMEDYTPFDDTWGSNGREHAFILYGTSEVVPEPASVLLLGTGLLGLGIAAVRRRESSLTA